MTSETTRFAGLARMLDALASPTRLALLHQLRAPQTLSDIRVGASLTREGERAERPLTRQSVTHHIEQLQSLGLVQRVPHPDGRGEGFVIDHARLFALVDEVRGLAKLRPLLPLPWDAADTLQRDAHARASWPPAPRLVAAYGREDGVAYGLGGSGPWRIGRGGDCEVRLDYDPYASTEHAVVHATDKGFTVTDVGSRNGTWLDWELLPRDRATPLRAGALLTVGRSVLVLQS